MQHVFSSRWTRYFIPNIGTLVLVALLLFAYRASAAPGSPPAAPNATPGTISYQGMLNDAVGQPINGNTGIAFRLYNTPTGATSAALWTEAHINANAVPVGNGLFNVLLGSLTPIPASVWNNANVYLGVQVGNDVEMLPRETIGDVPSASMLKGDLAYWADYRAYLRLAKQNGVTEAALCPEGGQPVGVTSPKQSLALKTGNDIAQSQYPASGSCINVHRFAVCGSVMYDFYPYAAESCAEDFSGSWAPFYWWDGSPSHDVTYNIFQAGVGCQSIRYACVQ